MHSRQSEIVCIFSRGLICLQPIQLFEIENLPIYARNFNSYNSYNISALLKDIFSSWRFLVRWYYATWFIICTQSISVPKWRECMIAMKTYISRNEKCKVGIFQHKMIHEYSRNNFVVTPHQTQCVRLFSYFRIICKLTVNVLSFLKVNLVKLVLHRVCSRKATRSIWYIFP